MSVADEARSPSPARSGEPGVVKARSPSPHPRVLNFAQDLVMDAFADRASDVGKASTPKEVSSAENAPPPKAHRKPVLKKREDTPAGKADNSSLRRRSESPSRERARLVSREDARQASPSRPPANKGKGGKGEGAKGGKQGKGKKKKKKRGKGGGKGPAADISQLG